jgi:integrase/recombinase XerD
VRRVTERARITKAISPHILRHAFITAAVDAGVLPESATSRQPRSTVSECYRG